MSLLRYCYHNFQLNGQADSFDDLDTEYQDYIWDHRPFYLKWLFIFPKYWNEYGHHREKIIIWTLLFLLGFTLLNVAYYRKLFGYGDKTNAYFVESISEASSNHMITWIKKLKYAFIYTSLIFFSFSIKTENINYKRKTFFYILFISVLGLVCLGYLANFIIQK